jgi:endonuclease G
MKTKLNMGITFLLAVMLQSPAFAATCDKHLPFGIPSGGPADKILCYSGYVTAYDYDLKVPSWTAYTLTKQSAHGVNVKRLDNFEVDRNIPRQFRSSGKDYKGSGYDRGHQANSAGIDYNRAANDETFLYSNITPQLAGFNRDMNGHEGAWGRVEGYVRKWIYKHDSLTVIAGTYFGSNPKTIGNGVGVPDAFYKIVINSKTGKSISFWLPHVEETGDLIADYIVSIDTIEMKTGIDFFARIPDKTEIKIESRTSSLGSMYNSK